MKSPIAALRSLARRFKHAREGSIALKFALLGPAVLLIGVGAIDLLAVNAASTRLQAIADAGALAGAPSLALATDGAEARERAAAFVDAQMTELATASALKFQPPGGSMLAKNEGRWPCSSTRRARWPIRSTIS